MTVRTNKILVQRYYDEMWNRWNFALADELLSAEISFRGSLAVEVRGCSAFCEYMRRVRNAFPDFHNKIEQLVGEEDQVVVRLQYTGTHRGEIFSVRPSGKSISYAGAAFFRLAGNRVTEAWVLGDLVSLLQQLGAQTLPKATN
jgi:steroid delta-isomerase-like uncharacterized protein